MTISTASSKTVKRRALEELALRTARQNFTKYKYLMYRGYQHADHLRLLDHKLEQVELFVRTRGAEGIGRLIVEMPPRHSKTLTTSKLFPSWVLGRNPWARAMLVSYGASLAEKNSRYVRNTFRQPLFHSLFPGVTLAGDSAAVDAWDIANQEGGADALGVEGSATGKGAHLLICDDLIKGRKVAESPGQRQSIWETFTADLYSRLEPGGAIILMGTRWHIDDITGRVLKLQDQPDGESELGGEVWDRLNLPALAEENDPLGRQPGEALWPWRYHVERLAQIKRVAGEYNWNALYQQRPIAAEGGLFKRANFNIISHAPEISQAVRFWDLAMSERTSADFSAGVKLGQAANGRLVVLDVVRRRVEWDQLAALMADTALMDGPDVRIGFEQQGYMSRAGQVLARDPRLHHYSIWGYIKDKDKFTNALPFASRCGLSLVDIVDGYFTHDYLDEMCSFPMGAHDDQIDASAGAYDMLEDGAAAESGMNYADEYQIGPDY